MSGVLEIARLGAQGDGVAETPAGQVFVPFTLPGEEVTAAVDRNRADLIAVRRASPLRVSPPCRHFGTCGGCALQHMEEGAYREWKREKVLYALRGRDIETPVEPLIPCAPASRRRVAFAARPTEAAMLLGFNQALSHTIVDIEECPVAHPDIVARLADIRVVAKALAATSKPFRITATVTASGLDLAAEGSGKLSDKARLAVSDLVRQKGFARLSVDGEIVIAPRRPLVPFGNAAVTPPPGAFLQAVETAEEAMATLVAGHLAGAKRIADLFSGCGTFALRLAPGAAVHAVESEAVALAALDSAARMAGGLKPVTSEKRDLFRRPLLARELDAFAGVVFDPPRAGAEAQCVQLAKSSVPRVAAVSCNPVTLARDLSILIAGGYRLLKVIPIDQFLWSPHVEAVALLEKPARRR